ncbi:MAG: glycosyltransferase [Clostridiales bacterium]
MNILILTGKFGMGHNAAALAIAQEITANNKDAAINIVDLPQYLFPNLSKYIYGLFNIIAEKCHSIYNLVNRFSEQAKVEIAPPNKIFNKLQMLIDKEQPNLIISTLPLCSQFISAYKKKTNCNIPLATCITDISAHKEWISPNTEMYFVPTNDIKAELIKSGVGENLVFVTGIPVKLQFKNLNPRTNNINKKNILIMGGGLGLLPDMDKLMTGLQSEENLHITVITGNNQKAFNYLTAKYKDLEIVGFTDKVSEYMQKADIIITKSGGITMFEALHSKTPMVIIEPFLEQERQNALFIEENHIGKVFWKLQKNTIGEIAQLLNNKVEQKKMQNNMNDLANSIAKYQISDVIDQYYLRKMAS